MTKQDPTNKCSQCPEYDNCQAINHADNHALNRCKNTTEEEARNNPHENT